MLDAYLAVIEALNPKLNAIVTLAAEQARDAARLAESAVMKGEPLGALHGLPIGVKDVTPTAGIRTTFASPLFKDYVPTEDAEAVRRLKAAGAIVLAKTNTPEFACGANTNNLLFGPTRNPWNPALSPAGSSGGSAAAVAAGMVPIAQGTDYGCSIRIPAAFCGIVGLRPTPGLMPSRPLHLPWDPGQVHGRWRTTPKTPRCFSTRSSALRGCRRYRSHRHGRAHSPRWSAATISRTYASPMSPTSPASASKMKSIRSAATPQPPLRNSAPRWSTSHSTPAAGRAAYQTWRGFWMVGQQYQRLAQINEFGPNLKGNVEAGLKLTALDFAAAEHQREQIFHQFRKLFDSYDVLLTPAAPVKPYPIEMNFPNEINGKKFENYIDWIAPAYLITLVSLPAATAPAGLSEDGLPVGMQIVAPRFEEPLILNVARQIQRGSGVGWPPVSASA